MEFTSAQAPDYQYFTTHFGSICKEEDLNDILSEELPSGQGLIDHLAKANLGMYDQKAASLLSSAATWAYSDADTMARMLRTRGIPNNETVAMHMKNDALFLEISAHVVQSNDGKLVLLCFGGTQPTNAIQLMLDASMKPDSFFSAGLVHGGFFRAFLGLWPLTRILLRSATRKYSVCDMQEIDKRAHTCQTVFHNESINAENSNVCPATKGRHPMERLYITGHSLGGALAVLAAAAICRERSLADVREKLCGVYTFGQPMVGDEVFAGVFEPMFGSRLFRHVYRRDVVPHLPPKTSGKLTHFGREYTAPHTTWELQSTQSHQAPFGLAAILSGAASWVKDQIYPGARLQFAYSLNDHSPINYVRTSMASSAGAEFLP
ncbi:lipase family protein [Sorangium cellulosum]|uniref:lipase family protein n=1 Tax=Sorangium cellulosum TaxID=56 RepID=UPI003D9AA589